MSVPLHCTPLSAVIASLLAGEAIHSPPLLFMLFRLLRNIRERAFRKLYEFFFLRAAAALDTRFKTQCFRLPFKPEDLENRDGRECPRETRALAGAVLRVSGGDVRRVTRVDAVFRAAEHIYEMGHSRNIKSKGSGIPVIFLGCPFLSEIKRIKVRA